MIRLYSFCCRCCCWWWDRFFLEFKHDDNWNKQQEYEWIKRNYS